jgi:hypothetical protein
MNLIETATRKTTILLCVVAAGVLAAGCDDKPQSSVDAGNVAVTPSGGQDGGTGGSAGASGDAGGSPDAGLGGHAGTGGVAGSAGAGGAPGAGGATGTGGTAGVPGAGGAPALAPAAPVGLAVVGSDYTSTSISLVSAAGALLKSDCINSGTGASGALSQTLSGDVTIPSQPQRGNELWLIDRGNAALLVLDPVTCAPRRQFSVATGFVANPHDVAVISDSKAYVTRFEKNHLATQAASGGGDDILIVNPQTGAIAGRIDLSSYAAPVEGITVQARPDRAFIAGGKVLVTLASQDANFLVQGEARLVVVDPQRDAVTAMVPLTGLKSCTAMEVLPGSQTLLVACSGAFMDLDQPLESGIALVDLSVDPPVFSRVLSSQLFASRPVNFSWVTAPSPTQIFLGTLGSFTPALSDGLFGVDPTNGHTTPLETAAAYDLGRAAGGGGRLLVPDATSTAPRVHVFTVPAAGAPTEASAFDPQTHGLPPREIAWY